MIDTTNIPSCYDRADGFLLSDLGTPTPIGTLLVNYAAGISERNELGHVPIFEEASDSPTLEFGEQCTISHKYFCDYETGISVQVNYPRGTVMQDSGILAFDPVTGEGNITRVLSTTLQPMPKTNAQVCVLVVTSEAQSFANPPPEFDVDIVELNPPIEKHPRYSALTYLQKDNIRNNVASDYVDVKAQFANTINTFSSSATPLLDQQSQALELMFKKQKGEDSFYLSGYKIVFSQYFWSPQIINPGGYIEDPFTVVPSDFWTTQDDAGGGDNIFSQTTNFNENVFPNTNENSDPPFGLSWLRQTDTQHLNRTWYKVTMTWIGAPIGHWDNELYNPDFQPYQTDADQGNLNLS